MIKFFRIIRQKLLSDGKTGKYFKYAIGEILLVVIGILIALQINNWNSNRKAYNQELELYSKLLIDVNTNFNNIDWKKNELKNYQNVYYQIFNESRGKAEYDPNMNYNFLYYVTLAEVDMSEKHSASLSSISNDSIRRLLNELIRAEKVVSDAYNDFNTIKIEQVKLFIHEHGIGDIENAFNDQRYNFLSLTGVELIDHAKLKEQYGSTELDGILMELRGWTGWAHENMDILEFRNNKLEEALVGVLEQNGRTENIKRIPRKHLSDLLKKGKSIDDVIQEIKNAQDGDSEYITHSYVIRALAFDLFREERINDAYKLYKLNTEINPEGPTSWQYLSRCLIAMGKKEEGIEAYEKFVELTFNPTSAKKELEELKQVE